MRADFRAYFPTLNFENERLHPVINKWAGAFNRAPVWKRQVRIDKYNLLAPNFDRWLYLKLHSLRLMGKEERNFLTRHVKPGLTVLDIGANIGLYSIFLAELVGSHGTVHAFEPDPLLFETALFNTRANQKDGIIKIENLALSSRSGVATLHRTPFNSGDNRLSASPGHLDTVAVTTARLDDIVRGTKIDFVKMDVQGWEAEVMRGMEETLTNNPGLIIYFEYWPKGLRNAGETPSAPVEILRNFGFDTFFIDRDTALSPQELEKLADSCPGDRFTNLLARKS